MVDTLSFGGIAASRIGEGGCCARPFSALNCGLTTAPSTAHGECWTVGEPPGCTTLHKAGVGVLDLEEAAPAHG